MIEDFFWFQAGYCTAIDRFSRRVGQWRNVAFPAAVGLWKHAVEGWILFDTGYAPRIYEATRYYPYRTMRLLTPTYITGSETVYAQLEKAGIPPTDIKAILISHLHADHTGGLYDFPAAKVYMHADVTPLLHMQPAAAFKQGVIKSILPKDLLGKASLFFNENAIPDPIFGRAWDMFTDGSIKVVPLPGHAIGQVGAIFSWNGKKYLLAADAAWFSQEIEQQQLPPFPGNLIIQDKTAYRETLGKLKTWQELHPEGHIIPTHCSSSFGCHKRAIHVV